MAIGAINELGARGLKVPADVSVVGFDDTFPAAVVAPSLTTVHQPLVEMGVTAVELLLARIRGESPSEAERRVLPTRLVIRESTAAPPAEREVA
jgi:DNA-binding LacI/PurR family transcriptional regulator